MVYSRGNCIFTAVYGSSQRTSLVVCHGPPARIHVDIRSFELVEVAEQDQSDQKMRSKHLGADFAVMISSRADGLGGRLGSVMKEFDSYEVSSVLTFSRIDANSSTPV